MTLNDIICLIAKAKENPQTLYFSRIWGSEPGGIRTHDLLIRSHGIKSAEPVDITAFSPLLCNQNYGFIMVLLPLPHPEVLHQPQYNPHWLHRSIPHR